MSNESVESGYSILEYQYRDAANWKTHGQVLLLGPATAAMRRALVASLEPGDLFVAEQVGIPALQREHHASFGQEDDLDHAFHEVVLLRPAEVEEINESKVLAPLDVLVKKFEDVKGRWDCSLSPFGRW